jgi:hypothetical protein
MSLTLDDKFSVLFIVVLIAIEEDSKDPQFMSNLNRLGPVRVEHQHVLRPHMHTVWPVSTRRWSCCR